MKEMYGDLLTCTGFDAICITTNGVLTKEGKAVMGRGIALQAKRQFPGIDRELGRRIAEQGVGVEVLTGGVWEGELRELLPWHIVAFPVKYDWRDPADISLIQTSVQQLLTLTNEREWKGVGLPRPGCGAGQRKWEEVKPLLASLDDRFTVFHTSERGT